MLKLLSGIELQSRSCKTKKKEKNYSNRKSQARRNQPITYRGIFKLQNLFRNFKGKHNSAREEKLGIFRRMKKNA